MAWPFVPVRNALAISTTLFLLAGCQPDREPPAGPPAAQAARELALDGSVRGELTTQSAMNMNDGSRYDVVDVKVPGDKAVRITLDSAFSGVLALYREGELVEGPSGAQSCCGESRGPAALVFQPAADAAYRIAVSGADRRGFGPFSLQASAIDIVNSGALESGKSLTGWLGRDTPLRGEHRANVYDVNLTEAGLYEFTLRSQDFDAYLQLRGPGVELEDDDSAGDLDARISAYLEPGAYSLRAGSLSQEGAGVYTVTSARAELPAGTVLQNDGELTAGQAVMGSISGKPRQYQFTVRERSRLTLTMDSDQFDAYLELRGAGVALEDDDSGGGSNARLDVVVEPGSYTINASALSGGGMYRLLAQTGPAPAAGGGEIAPGRSMEASLSSGRPDVYELRIPRAGSYVVTMRSTGVDSYLKLSGNGVQVEDDDGAGNLDARLAVDLAAGTYRLEASSVDQNAGVYQLSVE
ncbi:hypothetical protein FOZ76_04510 [Verticiella sediminum]|uniref:ABC transporter substrate-binding protein n=1 Tax=Verticiella sediminum TaxID=1247510 RepID=A0A556AYN7_9BURK|nr:hypothetical protein [Verticiella sediminum]TSH98053.1 hypothetical protein FOZ76_04510 [Verticiella sediminum]